MKNIKSSQPVSYSLMTALASELTKTTSLRSVWYGIISILAFAVYFSWIGATLLDEAIRTSPSPQMVEGIGGDIVPLERATGEALLGGGYQSMALFFPILVAVLVGQEFKNSQICLSLTASPSRGIFVTSKVLAVAILGAILGVIASLIAIVVVLPSLSTGAAGEVLSAESALIVGKTAMYSACAAMLTAGLTLIVRSSLISVGIVIVLFVVANSGALRIISDGLHGLLPMIAAKTFMFGYQVEPGEPGQLAGVITLLVWGMALPALSWIVLRKRDID